jgi:enterochelin esterase-like enzyme
VLDPQPGAHYPVLYLLHGFPGSPQTFVHMAKIATVADGLILRRELRALIVVMPVGGQTSSYNGEWAGPWERFVTNNVVPWIDRNLPTIPDPQHRAIGGLSAGGFGAAAIALRHPGLFGTIEAWDGYFHPLRDGPFTHATLTQLRNSDPTILAARSRQRLVQTATRFFLAAGTDDHKDVLSTRSFAQLLDRIHVQHVLVLQRGGHHDSFWRQILPPALAYTFPPQTPAHI